MVSVGRVSDCTSCVRLTYHGTACAEQEVARYKYPIARVPFEGHLVGIRPRSPPSQGGSETNLCWFPARTIAKFSPWILYLSLPPISTEKTFSGILSVCLSGLTLFRLYSFQKIRSLWASAPHRRATSPHRASDLPPPVTGRWAGGAEIGTDVWFT